MILRVESKYKVDTYFLKYNDIDDTWRPKHAITLLKDSIANLIIPEYQVKYRLQDAYSTIKGVKYNHSIKKITIY